MSCIDKLEAVKNSGYCEYIRPPIEKYGTLQFQDFDEIKDVGYRHGETYFKGEFKGILLVQCEYSLAKPFFCLLSKHAWKKGGKVSTTVFGIGTGYCVDLLPRYVWEYPRFFSIKGTAQGVPKKR